MAAVFQGYDSLVRWQSVAAAVPVTGLLGEARSLGVVVPHADDETLGCGGLIAAAAALGLEVTVTVLTDGGASHPGSQAWPAARLRTERRAELARAVGILTQGRGRVAYGDAPDGGLAADGAHGDCIAPADIIVTCWRDDPHPDHQAAFAIAESAAARLSARLLAFPLWVLTTALAPPLDWRLLSIAVPRGTKAAALAAHRSQLGELIDDDPEGFVLTPALQALFVRGDELYLERR